MNKSEKNSEIELQKSLELFNNKCIYFSPNNNIFLKELFRDASKTGTSQGIPDRIYYDNHILIIFECKKKNINKAEQDLKIYKNKIDKKIPKNIIVYYVAYVNTTTYKILDNNFKNIDKLLIPKTFNINNIVNKIDIADIKEIHNYIRDNTKISNEDKPFFIAIILLAIKSNTFRQIINSYDEKTYIYDIIKEYIDNYNIDISIFEFMKNDKNNTHFYHLIKKLIYIHDNCKDDIDLLNVFYTEFVRYNNTDSKSLGIVLTPPHIVELMIKLLCINADDIVLDFCTGTGSFLLEMLKYNPQKIIGCEYQSKLFVLLKCNMILRNIHINKYDLIKGDCFDHKFLASKSCINPPYGMSDKKELDFVLKQVESLKGGGLGASIFPIAKINKNTKQRQQLIKKAKIISIIICSEKLFYPSAGVKCCILLVQRCSTGHSADSDLTQILDYSDDGYEMIRTRGRCRTDQSDVKFNSLLDQIDKKVNLVKLNLDADDWTNGLIQQLYVPDKEKLINQYNEMLFLTKQLEIKNNIIAPQNIPQIKFKEFKISELFNILKMPSEEYKFDATQTDTTQTDATNTTNATQIDTTRTEYVLNIAAKNNNNGVKGFVKANKATFTGNKIVLITGGDGGAGLAFYQKAPFQISSATIVLEPKIEQFDDKIGTYIAILLSNYKKKYSRGYQWNNQRIINDTIYLPVDDHGNINYEFIYNFFVD